VELYHYFRERSESEFEAFESARRVVRGGVIEGGGPFTKDAVYLQGLVEVHSFLWAAMHASDPTLVRLLFSGKFDLDDVEALLELRAAGLLAAPKYLPPWAADLRFLVSYLSYSVFLNEIDVAAVQARYAYLFHRSGIA
jgi:hypothetical protein